MRSASRLLLSLALLAGGLTVAGGLGGAIRPSLVPRAAAASTGGTTVSVQGSTVTITVNIDLCCLKLSQHDTAQVAQLAQQAAAIWNDAFAKLHYKGCLTLHLAVNAHVLSPYNPSWEPGFDQVNAYMSDGRPVIIDPDPAATTPNVDTTSAYTQTLTGDFYLPNMDEQVWAHEIGHLMGLGDDYTDVKDANGVVTGGAPLPGRAGTIMAGGDYPPDQIDVNRIGDLISKAGTKLPTCWQATMKTHSEYHITSPANYLVCVTEWKFVLDFGVASDGALSGTGVADLQSVGTCHPYSIVIAKKLSFDVGGKMTTSGFTITVTPTGSHQPSGSVDITGMQTSLNGVTSGNGTFTLEVPFTDASHTLAKSAFSRKAADPANLYTTQSSVVIAPAP